jgi:hypothetical protein
VTKSQRRAGNVAAGVGLFLVAVVLPCGIAAHYGALSIPRSDDWSYLLTLFRYLDHGRLGFNNWVSMTLIGQLLLAAPVALVTNNSIAAVHVFVAVLGFVGLVALVGSAEVEFRTRAWVLAFTIAICPLWPTLAPTFMSEVPSFAVQCVFLWLAFRALRGRQLTYANYGGAIAVGFLAIAIRQYEAVPVIAVTVIALLTVWRHPVQRRRVLVVTGIATVATGALFAWWLSLPDGLSLAPAAQANGLIANFAVRMGDFVRVAGLCLLPVTIAVGPVRLVRRAWAASPPLTTLVAAFTTVWLAAAYLPDTESPFVGNYVHLRGTLGDDVLRGQRVPVMPVSLFRLLVVLGTLSAIVLIVAAVPVVVALWARRRDRPLTVGDPVAAVLGLSVVGFAAAYGIAVVTKLPVFDRYILQVLPVVGLALIRVRAPMPVDASARARTRALTPLGVAVGFVALALGALMLATDSASYDAARWHIDQAVVRQGWSPTRIYGGFEWIAWHRQVGPPAPDPTAPVAVRQRRKEEYERPFCIDVIVNPGSPRKIRAAIATGTVHGLGHAPERIIAVRSERVCPGGDAPH